jgi:hypothetical protein
MDESGPVRVNEGRNHLLSSSRRVIEALVHAFAVPALRKVREERAPTL